MIPRRRTPTPLSATEARGPGPLGPGADASMQPGPLWAKITGNASGTNRYSWEQVDEGDTPDFDAGLADDFAAEGGYAADEAPAYEVNGRVDVLAGVRVRVYPAGDLTYYLFTAPAPWGGAPDAPTSLTATPSAGNVDLSWTAPAAGIGVTQYVVYYSTSADMSSPVQFTVTNSTTATVTGLTAGTAYYFAVLSQGPGGSGSTFSNVANAVPVNEQIYTSGSGTFTATYTGNHSIECWAAGGWGSPGGGGNTGAGGGGGAYSIKTVSLTATTGYAYAVGAVGGAGSAGGDSTFDTTTVVAKGGAAAVTTTAGAGGAAAGGTGDTKYSGGNGGAGQATGVSTTGGGGGSSAGTGANGGNGTAGAGGGAGGTAPTGGGAGGAGGAGAVNGTNGTAPGGGGGGGGNDGVGGVGAGGSGAAGKIRITWPV